MSRYFRPLDVVTSRYRAAAIRSGPTSDDTAPCTPPSDTLEMPDVPPASPCDCKSRSAMPSPVVSTATVNSGALGRAELASGENTASRSLSAAATVPS